MADAPSKNSDVSLLLKNISLPLAHFSLEVDVEIHSPVTAIFGPSGAGKTSLLDLVAGLRRAKSAFIQLDGCLLTDTAKGVFVPTRHRGIGYVPQDLALFPHLSVRQNLVYGYKPDARGNHLFAFDHVASPTSPAAKNNASPWRAPCSHRPISCCSTNPSQVSI